MSLIDNLPRSIFPASETPQHNLIPKRTAPQSLDFVVNNLDRDF